MKNTIRYSLLLIVLSLFSAPICAYESMPATVEPCVQESAQQYDEIDLGVANALLSADEGDQLINAQAMINAMDAKELENASRALQFYAGLTESIKSNNPSMGTTVRVAYIVGKYAALVGAGVVGAVSTLFLGDMVIRLIGWDSWSVVQKMYAPSAQWSWYKRVGYWLGANISAQLLLLVQKFCENKVEVDDFCKSFEDGAAQINRMKLIVDSRLQEFGEAAQ